MQGSYLLFDTGLEIFECVQLPYGMSAYEHPHCRPPGLILNAAYK
jgi:hypothetical protein